jgi:cytochrome c-type biogenesis protein CcmH/NrfG
MVARLTARLEENPDSLEDWRMAARSFQTLGREEEWLNALAQIRRLSPNDLEALREHAHGLLLVRAISAPPDQETQAAFEALVASSPDDTMALVGLVLLRSNPNPDAETRTALEDLHAADPADPIALLGLAQAARVDGDAARARELLTRLVESEGASDALRSEVQPVLEALPAG